MRRTLIKSATIVSMDPSLGELPAGDLLVEGNRIADVRPSIDLGSGAAETEIVDGKGRIVIPGLINAHMHTWQTGCAAMPRTGRCSNISAACMRGSRRVFRPDDIYIATLVGALNQINCGTTTLVDWCHNNPTPAHTDAGVRGLIESGIRAAFFHGSPKPEPKPGEPHFSEVPHPRREVERLLAGPFADRNGLVTLGLAILGPHYSTLDVAMHDFRMAREFDLIASMHQGGGPAKTPGGWEKLIDAGLVGANVNIVHGNDLSDDLLQRLVDLGVSFSVTPENEMVQGHGFPISGRLLKRGIRAHDRHRSGIHSIRRPLLRRADRTVDAARAGQCRSRARLTAPFRRRLPSRSAKRCTGSRPKAPACSDVRARLAR